ncbi:MAG: hypothetical protein ACD_39C00290G0001 [uncultured bacterium]|nr:MAG: hypothetical protein ACD_39C00290G0001 [uncultured bacterium]
MLGLIWNATDARDFANIDVIKEIKQFNKSVIATQPAAFKHKTQYMSAGLFAFLRGTAHLMNADMQKSAGLSFLRKAPRGLVAGDLHIHNFSVFSPTGKSATYVIDDLDEAFADAPLSFDVFRLSTSLVIGFGDRLNEQQLKLALKELFTGYCVRAAHKKTYDWPQTPVSGFIKKFIAKESQTTQKQFIKKKTIGEADNRFDYSKHEPVPENEKKAVEKAMRSYLNKVASANRVPVSETEILDISQRFDKGLSSIGLKRYFVLLRGPGNSWKENHIIEVKIVRNSSVGASNTDKQMKDTLEALTRAHFSRDPYLGTVSIGGKAFLVRQNYPWSETIENTTISDPEKVAQLAGVLGFITADFHAQSGQGAAMKSWLEKSGKGMIPWVFAYARQLKTDWKVFKNANFTD